MAMPRNFVRFISYLAVFNLGSSSTALMAAWLVNEKMFPDIEITWKSWLNILFWLVTAIFLIVSLRENKNDEPVQSTN